MPSLITAVGTLLMGLLMSVVATILAPFQCVMHPNGMQTLRSYLDVVCWNPGPHASMVLASYFALCIPVFFLAAVAVAAWLLPSWMVQGNARCVSACGFLFFRFRKGAHWYIV